MTKMTTNATGKKTSIVFCHGMGATTTEIPSSHVPMLSHPKQVVDVIRIAVKGVQEATAAA